MPTTNNSNKYLDKAGTQHLVDKMLAVIDSGSVKSTVELDEAKKSGMYKVGNNASANKNYPSLLLVSTSNLIVMHTWFDNDGSVKCRRSHDGGDTWNDWVVFNPQSELADMDVRVGAVETTVGDSLANGKTLAAQVEDSMDDIDGLERTLDKLLDTNGAKDVIDTFKDVEEFLQGITDKDTLTGLLQEQRQQIEDEIPECKVIFISDFVNGVTTETQSAMLKPGNENVSIVFDRARMSLLLRVGASSLSCKYYTWWLGADKFGAMGTGGRGVLPAADRIYVSQQSINGWVANGGIGGGTIYLWSDAKQELYELHDAALKDIQARLKALEDAEPEVITVEEIDAMFNSQSMSTEPTTPAQKG